MITSSIDDNPIDCFIAQSLRRCQAISIKNGQKKFWTAVIEKVLLSLSDQQLLTGIAILISGLVKHCSISVYHFSIVSDLAWFSSCVQLTSLNVLNDYLSNRPQLRNWRICLMLVMLVLLLAYTILQGHRAWFDSFPYPAQCVFDDLAGHIGDTPAMWMKVNIFLLITAYGQSVLSLYPTLFQFSIGWAYDAPLGFMRAGTTTLRQYRTRNSNSKRMTIFARSCTTLCTFGLVAIRAVFTCAAALLGSTYVDFFYGLGWSAYGLWGLAVDRGNAKPNMDGNENDMTFGQLVPVLLLTSTIITFKDAYEGRGWSLGNYGVDCES